MKTLGVILVALALWAPSYNIALGAKFKAVSVVEMIAGALIDESAAGNEANKLKGLFDVEYIRSHEYESTFWKRLENTYLSTVSSEALKKGLPLNGYALTKLQSGLCASETPFHEEPLGSTIALVQRNTSSSSKERVYEGFKLKLNSDAGPFGNIGDVCGWFAFDQAQLQALVKALEYVKTANLEPNGTWVALGDAETEVPNEAIPTLMGEVQLGKIETPRFNHWTSADERFAVSWGPLIDPESVMVTAKEHARAWSYEVGGKPTGMFLTYHDDATADNVAMWHSASATFDWEAAPAFVAERERYPVVWTIRHVGDELGKLYVLTDTGLPRTGADIHIEKQLDTKLRLGL